MTDEEKRIAADLWTKHLQMIQDVITRQATSAAWSKRLSLVVVGGAVALTTRGGDPSALRAAIVLVGVFWFTDAKYLLQERWFRTQFDLVRKRGPQPDTDFEILPPANVRQAHRLVETLFSWSTFIYAAQVVMLAIMYYLKTT